jgi:hypothetical protein
VSAPIGSPPAQDSVDGKPSQPSNGVREEKRPRRWLRASRAALVTILGLAVTAWLIPAMSRQWDDRQKEHDLKAGIVADMSTSTARALVGGEAIWSEVQRARMNQGQLTEIGDQWALSAVAIDARLRSYFPGSSVVAGWELYSWAVDRFIKGNHVSMSIALQDAVQNGRLDPGVANAAAQLLLERRYPAGGAEPSFGVVRPSDTPITDGKSLKRLRDVMLARYIKADTPSISANGYTWSALERTLLDLEQAVAAQVVHAHASGFSTTPGDLLHDLIP